MAAIQNLLESWEGHDGIEVEAFLKAQLNGKAGYFKVVQNDEQQNILVGFASESKYDDWDELSDEDKWSETGIALMATYVILPSAEGEDTYSTTITIQSIPAQLQANSDVTINVKGGSQVIYAAGGSENISESLTLQVQVRSSSNMPWQTVGQISDIPSNSSLYTAVSLKNYLLPGMNYVRVRMVGEYASSIWKSFTLNVVNLMIAPVMTPQVPFNEETLTLQYLIGGAVSKVVQFEFGTGSGTSFVKHFPDSTHNIGVAECERSIGTSTNTSTGMSFQFTNSNLLNGNQQNPHGILLDGVHTVRARLYVSEAVKTDWVEYQYMVNRTSGTTPMVTVNNINSHLDNWTEVKFFDWAAYTGGNGSMQVNFRLANVTDTEDFVNWSYIAQDGHSYSFTTQLGIEIEDANISEFYGYMHIEDAEGNDLAEPIFMTFGNSASYQPTSGAAFIINPSTRNNSESNPARVINAVDGQEVTRGNETSVFTGFSFVSDGWVEVNKDLDDQSANAEKVRVLRIPANRKLTIPYNPFFQFTGASNSGKSVTLEIDFRTMNIVDESEPILRIGTLITGGVWGFEMLATEAYLLTNRMRSVDDQNVSWAEDMRTRLSINVIYNYNQTGLNLARIFLNGIIEREFFYDTEDKFTAASGVGIEIGNTNADIDIFGIRCYQKALSTSEVMQDFKATLGSTVEKIAFNAANDIKGDSDTIDWSKAMERYNVIGHTGHLPKYGDDNKGKTDGVSLIIKIKDDPTHSGTLTNLTASGQGTTAMTYYDWNQQYKINSNSVFTPDEGEAGAAGAGYAIQSGEALAKKLVGKINFASSMQSHKLGLTWIYNDLFKYLADPSRNIISKPSQMTTYPSARIAVFEKPFLFFHRETENDPWEFKYLMTFGAGKGDKPTFGFDKNTTGHMLMVEGANNDRPLALFRIPWNDDITYDKGEEAWMYNNQKQLNFGFGKTSTDANNKEYPSDTDAINAQKAFFNFVYLHYSRIEPFMGTLAQLQESASADKSKMYWVTQASTGSAQYNLYRWDVLYNGIGKWVDAGVTKLGNGSYETLNIRTQYEAFCTDISETAATWTSGLWSDINDMAINMRRAHFKAKASTVLHVDDALYHSCFVKFYAGTDNRAKNTYYYTDPSDLKIRFEQDDLDTMIKTNNVGQNRKPYYVEEHDTNQAGEFYWQGESSGLFNLLEEAFEAEMTSMMNNMMSAMAAMGGSVMGFHEQYFLSTQDYFPAFAYNEQARLVYEAAAVAQAAGTYDNSSVQAITQSVGSQRWSEYQWLKDRIMYISSWCEYGEFARSSSAPNGLSWRGYIGTYKFKLTPAKWLYPRIGSDSGNYDASTTGSRRVRVPAGTQFTYPDITLDSDSWISIRGINYYFDIGDMNVPLSSQQGTFVFSGKKLQKIHVNPNGTATGANMKFLATRIEISNATNIKEFVVRNVSTLTGQIDLRKCSRLEKIDLRNSTCTSVDTSDTSALRYLYLPATLTALSLVSPANLTTFSMPSMANLTEVHISGDSGGIEQTILTQCMNQNAPLTSVSADVNWTGCSLDLLDYLAAVNTSVLKGSIEVASGSVVTLGQKQAYLKWGNIDDQNNPLHITYVLLDIEHVFITGQKYFTMTGTTQFGITAENGNNVAIVNGALSVNWSIQNNDYIEIIDAARGIARINQLNAAGDETRYTLTVVVNLIDNTTVTATWKVGAFKRLPVRGDFAYADGSFDDEVQGNKTMVGFVFGTTDLMSGGEYVSRSVEVCSFENPYIRSADSAISGNSHPWGPQPGTNNSTLPQAFLDEVSAASDNVSLTGLTTGGGQTDYLSAAKSRILINVAKKVINGYLASMWDATNLSSYEGSVSNAQQAAMYRAKSLASQRKLPSTPEELGDMMEALELKMGVDGAASPSRYRMLFFPAAYCANIYEPAVKAGETLHNSYKREEWVLPASGTMYTIYKMYHASRGKVNNGTVTSSYANEDNTVTDDNYPLFANLLKRMEDAGMSTTRLAMLGNDYWWSCSEGGATNAWGVRASDGNLSYNLSKSSSSRCRAVAAFTFPL